MKRRNKIKLIKSPVIEIPRPSRGPLLSFTILKSPTPWFFLLSVKDIGGSGSFSFALFLPLHARITVLWRCKCISDSNWFHKRSCSSCFNVLPNNCICCIRPASSLSKYLVANFAPLFKHNYYDEFLIKNFKFLTIFPMLN